MRAMVTHTERRQGVDIHDVADLHATPVIVDVIEDWIGESPNGFERRRQWYRDLMSHPALAFDPEFKRMLYLDRIVAERQHGTKHA